MGTLRHRHWGFKVFIVVGFLLGVGLLTQTISTYIYVSDRLVRQEAQKDSSRRASSLERAIRQAGSMDPGRINDLIEDAVKDWQGQVVWARLVDANGGDRVAEVRNTESGQVFVSEHPFRAASTRQKPMLVEIAVSMDSISASFASLRRNLIIGVTAAIALLTSLVVIGLRFPNYLRGKQIEAQLDMARNVQSALLPKSRASGNIQFAAECIPAAEVGGDICDVFEADRGRTAIVVGDVSGKGMSAALLMGLIHGAIHSSPWTGSARDHEDASERLNDLLRRKTTAERFATLFWGYYEPEASVIRYVNAGHLPPLLIRRGEGIDLYVQRLDDAGPLMGILDWGNYQQKEAYVQEGDLLVAFSDGIAEAMNSAEDQFGEQRILKTIGESWNRSPAEIKNAILNQVRLHTGEDDAVQDDQTLLVARFEHVSSMRDNMLGHILLEGSPANA